MRSLGGRDFPFRSFRKAAWAFATACCLALIGGPAGCINAAKDEGGAPPHPVRGDFRKGPFAARSEVRVSMLDRGGQPDGRTFRAATENDSGDFRLDLPGGMAEFSATGRFFDEFLGALSNYDLTLVAVAPVPQDAKHPLHANVFTHLASARIERLMGANRKGPEAVAQAEKEVRAELGVADGEGASPAPGASLDLLGGDNPHTLYLLALTGVVAEAALQKAAGRPELAARQLQGVLDSLASDLAGDGKLGPDSKAMLAAAERELDPARIRKALEAWAKAHGGPIAFPDPAKLVDSDKDGKPNALDPDDDGDGVADELDCAPLDPARQMVSADGQRCVAVYAPGPLLGNADDRQVRLIWDEMPGDPRYTVYYSQGEGLDTAAALKVEGARPGQAVGGLSNGKPYWFAIAASFGALATPLSAPVRLVPVGIASGFKAVAGTGKVLLDWTPAEGAEAYTIYFREGAGVDKNDRKVVGVKPPFTLTGLRDGARHDFALASTSGGSESRLGDTITATPIQAPPRTRAAPGDRLVIVSWDTAAGATGYDVLLGRGDSVGTDATRRKGRTSPDTLRGLDNGQRYAVRVQATSRSGASDLGPSAWTIPMGAPSDVRIVSATGRLSVDWKPAEGATSYMVYYWIGSNLPQRVSVAVPPAELRGLANGAVYSVRVAPSNSGLESGAGDTAQATPLAPPDSIVAAMQDGGIDLAWKAVPGATGYTVFYKQGLGLDTTDGRLAVKEPHISLGGLLNDQYYALTVRAENATGRSDPGAALHAMPMRPPQGFSAATGPDKVALDWEEVTGATRYDVYYRKASSVDKGGTQIANARPGIVVTDLEHGEVYTFAVEAIKDGFAGPLSDPRTVQYVSSTLPAGQGSPSDTVASYLSLAVDGNDKPYLAFVDLGKNLAERNLAKVVTLASGRWTALPAPSTTPPYTCCELRIGPGEAPNLAFGDGESGNRLVVKAFDGSGWSGVGAPMIVTEAKAEFVGLAFDGLGIPYAAYNDSAAAGRVSVRRLEGSRWAQVGLPGFSTNAAGPLSLAFTRANQPCLVSGPYGAIAPAVMAFDGTGWQSAGDVTGMLSRAAPGPLPFLAGPGGQFYLAFADKAAGFKATVVSGGAGSGWNAVGQPGFSDGSIQEIALAIDPAGTPFAAFTDDSRNGRVSVMKFANGAWTPACRPGFSLGRAHYVRIAVSRSGSVFVAYQDEGAGGRAQVVKLNGNP